MNFKTQEIKRIIIKSPLIPLFQRGKLLSPPFGIFFLPKAGKGRSGGIFKTLKCYQLSFFIFLYPVRNNAPAALQRG